MQTFKILASTESTIINNCESLLKCHLIENSQKHANAIKCIWVKMVWDKNMLVSGPLIKERALEYTKILGHKFQASAGCLGKFKKHHCIKKKVISRESGSVSEEDCSQWKTTIILYRF